MEVGVLAWLVVLTILLTVFLTIFCVCDCTNRIKSLEDKIDALRPFSRECVTLRSDVSDLTKQLERFSADMRDLKDTIASNNFEMMVVHPSIEDCV